MRRGQTPASKTPVPGDSNPRTQRDSEPAWLWSLGLLTLSGFAVAQPLFSLLRRYPEFLVAHRASLSTLLLLSVSVSLLLPLGLALPSFLLKNIAPRLARASFASSIFLLATLWWAQSTRQLHGLSGLLALGVILLLGLGSCWLYFRHATLRRVLAILAFVALLLPLAFLMRAPIRDLWESTDQVEGSSLALTQETPAVLLVLDELPLNSLLDGDEKLDRSRYPNFTQLADDGVWYRNATTVAESTSYAVPAILSGRYPFAERLLPTAGHYPTNLFTLLGESYDLHVAETITALCPGELCGAGRAHGPLKHELIVDVVAIYLHLVVPKGMGYDLPQLGDRWTGFWENSDEVEGASATTETGGEAKDARRARQDRRKRPGPTFERFIAEIGDYPPKTLHYLHVLLPHAPWRYVPTGHSYQPLPNTGAVRDPETGDFTWAGEDSEVAQGLQRHLLQTGFVDRLLGRLSTQLRELGLYDRSLIIVTADHGAAFKRGHSTRHPDASAETLAEIANVPLIIKYPGGARRGIDDSNVESIDILPTLVAALGGEVSRLTIDGLALQQAERRGEKRIYPSWGPGSARGTARLLSVESLISRRATLLSRSELLGGEGWASVYALGPFGDLLGKKRSQFKHGGDVAIRMDNRRRLANVDLESQLQPLLLSGSLNGPHAEPVWLALLVNGRVAAVTRTTSHDGSKASFRAMIPSQALLTGSNRVRAVSLGPFATEP